MKYLFLVLIGAFCTVGAAQDNSVLRHWGGGVIVPQSKYPAVIQIEMNKSDGKKGYCSASIVGPRTILTASHCGFEKNAQGEDYVPKDKTGTFEVAGKKYKFNFVSNIQFSKELTEHKKLDIALGITEEVIVDVNPLSINFTDDHSKKMFALGYGCTGYYLSETIVKNRQAGPYREDISEIFLISADDSITTFACNGDSGGPTLAYTTDLKLRISSIHMRRTNDSFWDMRTNNTKFIEFILNTADKNNLKVCGFNMDCD